MSSISAMSTRLVKKMIPLPSLNSITKKKPVLSLSCTSFSKRNTKQNDSPDFVSLLSQLRVINQSELTKCPVKTPPAFSSKPNEILYLSHVPREVLEFPKRPPMIPTPPELICPDSDPPRSPYGGPDFPRPPMPLPPDPDYPKPFPDTPPPKPPDKLPDILPPRKPDDLPPPLSPPAIPPLPDGPPVVF